MDSLLAICIAAVFCVVSVSAVCDSSSSAKIQQCVFQSELFNPGSTPKSEAAIQNFCRDNMNNIVDCMDANLQECSDNPKEKKLMDLLVSIPDTRAGLLYMCNNISVFTNKAACFQSFGDSSFTDCLQNAVGEITNAGEPSDLKSGMDSVCRFFDSFTGCFTNPFTGDCSPVGTIYGRVFNGVKYPYCKMNAAQRQAAIKDYEMTGIAGCSAVRNSFFLITALLVTLKLL